MGRGKRFTSEEIGAVAAAYAWATNDAIKGAEQKRADYIGRVLDHLKTNAPTPIQDGTYHERGIDSTHRCISEMKKDIAKFMKSLRMVESVELSGISPDQVINIAVAIHLHKTNKPECKFKDFNALTWQHYPAFLVLRNLPQFAVPPNQSNVVSGVTPSKSTASSSSPKEDDLCGLDDDSKSKLSTPFGMKRAASRGGSGVKKAKLEAIQKKGKEKAAQITELNKSVQDLVAETKRIREGQDEDRHLARLCMLMECCPAKRDEHISMMQKDMNSKMGMPPNEVNVDPDGLDLSDDDSIVT